MDGGCAPRPLVIFGRVPLFFYLLHIPLIHGLAIGIDRFRFGYSPMAHKGPWDFKEGELPEGYGFNLPMIYLIWL
jgi:hypothetical protein